MLHGNVVVDLELRPYKVGLLPLLCKAPPASSLDQTSNQLRIVAFPHENLHFGILGHHMVQQPVRKGNFPDKIFVVVPFEGDCESFDPWPVAMPLAGSKST